MASITYTTGLDGWGSTPSDEDTASFEALVEERLTERFPGYTVGAFVDPHALESKVLVTGDDVDAEELRSWIGNDVWNDWCSGARAKDG